MKYGIKEEVYIILLKYFEGDVMNLTLEKVKDLKNMTFDGKPIKEINKIILKEFGTLIRLKTKNPKKYASIKWVYPDWDKEEKEKRLRDAFPEDYEKEKEEEEEEKGKPVVVHDNLISPQNGKHFTYKEQIEILIQFYKIHEPDKTEKEIVGIIDRRRNKGDPKGSRRPSKPWHELCSRIEGKYG